MPRAQGVSDVIIVNHHGAADVLGALASLEWPRCGAVHIVDNSVDAQQADALRAGTAGNAQVQLTISERATLGLAAPATWPLHSRTPRASCCSIPTHVCALVRCRVCCKPWPRGHG